MGKYLPTYAQRMNIGGISMMFNTDQPYSPAARLVAVFAGTCNDGTIAYDLVECDACLENDGGAASSYRELAQLASLDRLNSKANTQLAEYRSPLRRDEPDSNPPAPSSALAGEDRRRHSPRFLFTLRG